MVKRVVITSIVGLGVCAGSISAYQNFELPDPQLVPAYSAEDLRLKRLKVDAYAVEVANARLNHDLKRVKIENAKIIAEFETMQQLERSQSLAWVVTTSQGLWYLSVGLVPVGALVWVSWRVWRTAKQEDEDRLTVTIASGNYPVNRAFVQANGHAFYELVAQKALYDGLAKVEGARRVDLPSLTTFNHQPTVTHTSSHETRLDAVGRAQAIDDKIAHAIKEALAGHNIGITAEQEAEGPQCRTYALKPAKNEKGKRPTITQIEARAKDIAFACGVKAVRLIQEAGYIACEVPRDDREFVQLNDLLNARTWIAAGKAYALPIALGKDTKGNAVIVDLASMPHLLIGGSTGMGKSVILRSIIHCLNQHENVQIWLFDPKRVEFSPFTGLANVAKVAKSVDDIDASLEHMFDLMEQRKDLFEAAGVQNISQYNGIAEQPIPYIVGIVDEISALFQSSETADETIGKLTQEARFAGIHIILATQKPDAETVKGNIRSNLTARLAVRCSEQGQSRTILDAVGAEKLLDRGDSLYKNERSEVVRLQTAYCDVELVQSANKESEEVGEEMVKTGEEMGEENDFLKVSEEGEEVRPSPFLHPFFTQISPLLTAENDEEVAARVANGESDTAIMKAVWGTTGGKRYKERKAQIGRVRGILAPHMAQLAQSQV